MPIPAPAIMHTFRFRHQHVVMHTLADDTRCFSCQLPSQTLPPHQPLQLSPLTTSIYALMLSIKRHSSHQTAGPSHCQLQPQPQPQPQPPHKHSPSYMIKHTHSAQKLLMQASGPGMLHIHTHRPGHTAKVASTHVQTYLRSD